MELHIWPGVGGAQSLDAECLAAAWLVSLMDDPTIAIIPSGNIYVTDRHKLPALVGSGVSEAGFTEIDHYLRKNGFETKLLPQDPRDILLQAYIDENVSPFTQWTLFLHDPNWTGITRKEVSQAFPFPMQYNAALNLQNDAQDAAKRHRATAKLSKVKEKEEQPTRGVTELHTKVLKETQERKEALKVPKDVVQATSRARAAYRTITGFMKEDEELRPAYLLLGAHMVLQTLPTLPQRPLNDVVEESSKLAALRDSVAQIQVNLRKSRGPFAYNLWNYAFSFTPWSAWH